MLPSLINNNKIGVKLIKELLLGNILANPAPPIPSEESKRPTGEAEMPVQATHVTDLMKEIQDYVNVEVAANVDMIMNNLEADKSLFNGPSEANTETSVRKSIETAAIAHSPCGALPLSD